MSAEWINETEDLQTIQYYCLPRTESTETMVANCTIINGTWNPDPKGLSCPVTKFENDTYSAPVPAGKYHDHCIITMHACT